VAVGADGETVEVGDRFLRPVRWGGMRTVEVLSVDHLARKVRVLESGMAMASRQADVPLYVLCEWERATD
jgi:hypothetical protein